MGWYVGMVAVWMAWRGQSVVGKLADHGGEVSLHAVLEFGLLVEFLNHRPYSSVSDYYCVKYVKSISRLSDNMSSTI